MLTKSKLLIACGLLALTVMVGSPAVYAQIVYGQPTSGNIQFSYNHWKAETDQGEETIDQLAFPISGFFPLKDNLDLSLYAIDASNTYDNTVNEYKLSGLGDVRLQLSQSFLNDRLLACLGVNLPTGKKELDSEQGRVLLALSQNYYEFPTRRLGEGFGLTMLVGGAVELKPGLRAGGGLSYQYAGKYTPYESYSDSLDNIVSFEDYDPGDLFSANGGFDLERGPMLWSLDLIFSQYLPDKLDDIKIFRQSRQFDWRFSGTYTGEGVQVFGSARYLWRGKNRLYNDLGEWDATRKLYGNEFQLAGAVQFDLATNWTVAPSLDLRLIAKTDVAESLEIGSANVLGIGTIVGRQLGEQFAGNLGFKYYTGSADGGGIDLSGYRITFGITASM